MNLERFIALRAEYASLSTPDGCWIWRGATTVGGYGQLAIRGVRHAAHRLSWALVNGPIPAKHFICHTCDTPRCINPRHLYAALPADNTADMIRKKRAGHQKNPDLWKRISAENGRKNSWSRGVNNPNAKLSEKQVIDIRNSHRRTMELAREYGVHRSTILRIRRQGGWSSLDGASARAA